MTRPVDYELPLVGKPFVGDFRVSSKFGVYEKVRGDRQHTGVDYACPEGTPLIACFDGEALFKTKDDGNGAGNRVHVFDYKRGLRASYFHLRDFTDDKKAKAVKKGDLLGWSGNTGHSSGPHLHFEIRRLSDSEPLRPYLDTEFDHAGVVNDAPYTLPKGKKSWK